MASQIEATYILPTLNESAKQSPHGSTGPENDLSAAMLKMNITNNSCADTQLQRPRSVDGLLAPPSVHQPGSPCYDLNAMTTRPASVYTPYATHAGSSKISCPSSFLTPATSPVPDSSLAAPSSVSSHTPGATSEAGVHPHYHVSASFSIHNTEPPPEAQVIPDPSGYASPPTYTAPQPQFEETKSSFLVRIGQSSLLGAGAELVNGLSSDLAQIGREKLHDWAQEKLDSVTGVGVDGHVYAPELEPIESRYTGHFTVHSGGQVATQAVHAGGQPLFHTGLQSSVHAPAASQASQAARQPQSYNSPQMVVLMVYQSQAQVDSPMNAPVASSARPPMSAGPSHGSDAASSVRYRFDAKVHFNVNESMEEDQKRDSGEQECGERDAGSVSTSYASANSLDTSIADTTAIETREGAPTEANQHETGDGNSEQINTEAEFTTSDPDAPDTSGSYAARAPMVAPVDGDGDGYPVTVDPLNTQVVLPDVHEAKPATDPGFTSTPMSFIDATVESTTPESEFVEQDVPKAIDVYNGYDWYDTINVFEGAAPYSAFGNENACVDYGVEVDAAFEV
ncbi:hypothetical protein F5Y15DRAFT_32574 [Xylariaceae sp. FL0016]|nr:hypothetical protein F5Y15DRAFT_32574 [Xylariaceae sp. FL0016]